MRPPRRMAGPRTAAAGTSGISDSGGVTHGPGRRPLVWGGVMHALPRRRGADGLRGEALGPRYSPPSRLRRRSAASRDRRPSRSSHAAYFALMRASSVLPGFPTSEWRDSNPRPRGPQPRALPTAPHSVRTPVGTRTWIDGCDILPRLMRGGGFLLKNPFGGFSIDRLSPHALWFARFYESCRSISLLPSSRMFRAAFTSRSCRTPQDGHVHSRTDRFLTCGFR